MAQVAPKSDDSNLYFFQLCNREATLGDDYHYLQEGGPPADRKVLAVHAVHLGLLRHPGGRDDDLDNGSFDEYSN